MTQLVNQVSPAGLHAPGLPQRDYPPTITGTSPITITTTPTAVNVAVGALGLLDGGVTAASYAAVGNTRYRTPTGGTITLPTATGGGDILVIALYGTGVTTFSGTISVGGSILSSFTTPGDQTFMLTDADATRGWV